VKRAVILLGAGASKEFGVPLTAEFSETIEKEVLSDAWVRDQEGDAAYRTIKCRLSRYLEAPVNFEHIYHCAHELIYLREPTPGFRPVLVPFLRNTSETTDQGLRALAGKIIDVIYKEVGERCAKPACSLDPLTTFLNALASTYRARIYTTNYDVFPLQASPGLYTGYLQSGAQETRFDQEGFWHRWDMPALFHLHGSVHMSYSHTQPVSPFADLVWFEDRDEARKSANFSGSGLRRMDGSEVLRTPIITGLDKLSRIQQRPLPYFYAALTRDVMEADIIYVIGAGLGDLHLNSLLQEARSRSHPAPLLFIDWWDAGFILDNPQPSRKEIEMCHSLAIHIGGGQPVDYRDRGWTISQGRTAAIWDRGFQAFLAAPMDHDDVLHRLTHRP
jgi:hypothetical protein